MPREKAELCCDGRYSVFSRCLAGKREEHMCDVTSLCDKTNLRRRVYNNPFGISMLCWHACLGFFVFENRWKAFWARRSL